MYSEVVQLLSIHKDLGSNSNTKIEEKRENKKSNDIVKEQITMLPEWNTGKYLHKYTLWSLIMGKSHVLQIECKLVSTQAHVSEC